MKVAIVNRNLAAIGGLEVFCRGLIEFLHGQRIETHVITAVPAPFPCQVHVVRSGRLGRLSTLAFAAGAARICRGVRPDVVNIHALDGHSIAALWIPDPTVISVHGFHHFAMGRLIRRLRPRTRILANSEWAAAVLREAGGIACDGFVYPLAPAPPRPDRRASRAALGLRDEDVLVLHVGRCVPPKGQAALLHAARLCTTGSPDARRLRFALLGGGKLKPGLDGFVRQERLESSVRLPGEVPHEETGRWFSAADIYVQPSLYDARVEALGESFGLTVIEAMAAGLPLVLSDIGLFRELAGEADCAAFFSQGNAPELARALEDLARQPDRRRAMGVAAAARHGQRFLPDGSWREYAALYRSLAAPEGGSACRPDAAAERASTR
jgi:glycosyltransferase involved in cell wall biosynthesis